MKKSSVKNEAHCLREMSNKSGVTYGFTNKLEYG
jgi:hypothetical protein